MLGTASLILWLVAGLAFVGFAFEPAGPYDTVLFNVLLNGLGLGTLFRALHVRRTGECDLGKVPIRREENGLIFPVVVFLLFACGFLAEGVALMVLFSS